MTTKLLLFAALCVGVNGQDKAAISGFTATDGAHQYKMQNDDSGKPQWVVDKEAEDRLANWEAHRSELVQAVVSRVLTEKEMAEFVNYGSHIFVHNMEGFYEKDINDRFNAAIVQQYKLREIAAHDSSNGIAITKQEAADVTESLQDGLNGLIVAGQFYAVAANMKQPNEDHEAVMRNLETVVARAVKARSILAAWKEKVGAGK